MKKIISCIVLLASCFLLLSCGSSGSKNPVGPDLDISELLSIKIDQLKLTGGMDDDNDTIPEAAIYLRCKESARYLACAGQAEGMDIVTRSGVAYGKLDIPLIKVSGADGSCLDVEVVFVEKDSNDCPNTVTADDDILGVSQAVSLNESGEGNLLGNKIETADDTNWVRLFGGDTEEASDMEPSSAITDAMLTLDQLYFTKPDIYERSASFKLVVKDSINTGDFRCEASFDKTSGIIKENIIYGGLGIQLLDANNEPCAITNENKTKMVDITLTILADNGNSVENLVTDPEDETTLGDLIDNDGMREKFTDDAGFVRFSHIDGF